MKKKITLLIAIITITFVSCKVKSSKELPASNKPVEIQNSNTQLQTNTVESNIENKTLGKVSHKYRAGGCNSVIEVKLEGDEVQTLIPKDKLAANFDIDGLEIYFNFHLLRMPQPAGCSTGQPAEITDIIKK
ncbi:MAG TPA: hypothetical protein PK323_06760 [Bacteroidia bacterium]|nr:hypothetical protein [Bacteroidia bacterium]